MSNGPTLLFDKSAIQRLGAEEARWLMHFFRGVITPVYQSEVLGNLAKPSKVGTAEARVASLAGRVLGLGSMANVLHNDLIDQELLGNPVQMRRFPVVAAEAITAANGERGVLVSETPGERAMHRWSGKAFNADEHEIAREFRNSAKMDTSLAQLIRIYKGAKPKGHSAPASLNEALDQITFFLDDPTAQYRTLQLALSLFDQPEITRKHIKRNWIRYGRTPIRHFVPYTFFCLRLLLLFKLGVATSLIDQRPTNVLDLQYLFYLTFCMVFLSADKLHLKLAPLFLNDDQRLAASDDMQLALKELSAYYRLHANELQASGTMGFAAYPPLELNTYVHALYDTVMPGWRHQATQPRKTISPEESARIMEKLRPMRDAIEAAASKRDH